MLGIDVPLLSFSFHFAKLPTGPRLALAKWAFSRVRRFTVHSEPERARYSMHFGISMDRIDLVRWGVRPSSIDGDVGPPIVSGTYISALGKDGRDYRTLIHAMRRLPELRLALVVQPHNLAGIEIPDNVTVHFNIPTTQAMNILRYSQFMALPLETDETSCGHITIVSAMFCRKAIVSTGSSGIADYFPENYGAPKVAAGDVEGWVDALKAMSSDPERRARCETVGEKFGLLHCSHDAAFRLTMEVFRRASIDIPLVEAMR
jgi:glycosyltransferase involved in cell wall biosynthesis